MDRKLRASVPITYGTFAQLLQARHCTDWRYTEGKGCMAGTFPSYIIALDLGTIDRS